MTGLLNHLPVNHGVIVVNRIKRVDYGSNFVEDLEQITTETSVAVSDETEAERVFIETILKTPECLHNIDATVPVISIPLYIKQASRQISFKTHRDEGNTIIYNSADSTAINNLLTTSKTYVAFPSDLVPVGSFIVYNKSIGTDAPAFIFLMNMVIFCICYEKNQDF